MAKHSEHTLVKKCLLLIEKQLDWGDAKSWHNDMFSELSEKIRQKTNVLLSPTTLKRVWGRLNYDNAPSISTLNTLAQFAGFLNWRDFKNTSQVKQTPWLIQKIAANFGIIIISAAIMTIVFLSFYSLSIDKGKKSYDTSDIEFSSRPITEGLPNSVVFDFNLDSVRSDNIHIQQFWDPTKTIAIKNSQSQATGQYYYPGYFRAKLVIDGIIVKEEDLFIKTKDWIGTLDYDPVPKYIRSTDILNDNLAFKPYILNEIKSLEKPLVSSFHLVNDMMTLTGDHFSLSTSIKNVYNDKWAVCQQTSIVIVGKKSAFIIPFSIPGCVSEIEMLLSDVSLSGKEHDLSALGTDLSEFRDIRIEVKNNILSVFIDNKEVFSYKYSESIGDIVGVRFRFLGAGEVDYLRIDDHSSNLSFIENFESRNP